MRKPGLVFLKDCFLRGFVCLVFSSFILSIHASASCYDLLLSEHIQLRLNKKSGIFRTKHDEFNSTLVETFGHNERYHSQQKIETLNDFQKPPRVVVGLEPKTYGIPRSEEQVSAWFQHISGRFRKIRENIADAEVSRANSADSQSSIPPTSLMSIEEFLGLLDGAFASDKYPLAKILKDFDIKNIRFVDGKSFDANQKMWITRMFKKNEIILEVPNADFENRLEAALWMKSFILTLFEAAKKVVISAQDDSSNMVGVLRRFNLSSSDKPSAKELWEEDSGDGISFKKKTENLIYAVSDMNQELTVYIENLTSGSFVQNELVKLKEKNFEHQQTYPIVNLALEANGYSPFAPFTAFIKTHPLNWYEPTRYWLEGKRAIRLERVVLEHRMQSYFSRRKRTAVSNLIGFAIAGSSIFNYLQQGSPVDLDDKKDELLEKTKKLNSSNETFPEDINDLKKEYARQKEILAKAEKVKDDKKVIETNKKLLSILQRLEALDLDK